MQIIQYKLLDFCVVSHLGWINRLSVTLVFLHLLRNAFSISLCEQGCSWWSECAFLAVTHNKRKQLTCSLQQSYSSVCCCLPAFLSDYCWHVFFCLAEKYEELYCFSFHPNVDNSERVRSWEFLDLKAEYNRMGLPNKQWHVTPINREYTVSMYHKSLP